MTNEEFQVWKRHPISKLFFQYLNKTVTDIHGQWASGAFIRADDLYWTGTQNVHAFTKAETLIEVINLQAEDIADAEQ